MISETSQRLLTASVAAIVIALAACRPVVETANRHVAHRGEDAIVQKPGASEVFLGASRDQSHAIAEAVAAKDQNRLTEMVKTGQAIQVPAGTRVRVLEESFNERFVRVLEGPGQGREGWVPFEWLAPAVPAR